MSVRGRLAPVPHPLTTLLRAAAAGSWPADDGGWSALPAWRPGVGAVVAMTGHAYLCSDRPLNRERLEALGCNGIGGATQPDVMIELAGHGGWIDCLDVLLVARGRGVATPALRPRPDLKDHPRALHARLTRGDVTTFGYADPDRRDVATVGRGPGDLAMIGVEVDRPGHGARIFADVLDLLPPDLVLASVAPGNARSLRAALRAGFAIIGSVQLFVPAAESDG